MEALKELEQKLQIRPLNFKRFQGEIISPPVTEEVEEPIEQEESPEKQEVRTLDMSLFSRVADSWGVEVEKVQKLYEQVNYYYENSNDAETVRICGQILDGLYKNSITRQQVNGYIQELGR